MMQDDDDDDDDNDDPMILNIRAKNHTSERTIVPWTVIFLIFSRVDAKHFLIETGDDNSEAEGLGDLPEVNGESK